MGSNTPLHGLSEAEARRRLEAGGGNASPVSITKSAGQIVREHVCTLFNLFNVLIAAALVLSDPIRPGAVHTLDYFRRGGSASRSSPATTRRRLPPWRPRPDWRTPPGWT